MIEESVYHVWRAWYTVLVFELVLLIAGMETSIVTLLVHPIERSFQIDDVGFAGITVVPISLGLAAVYYPAGLLADTFRRRDIILGGIVIWVLAALLSSRADSSMVLFLARLLAGAGLGVSGPPMFSIISDAFPRMRRAFAISVYYAGSSIGWGLGLTLCETLIQAALHNGSLRIGVLLFAPWQQCFIAVAAMGAAVLALVLTLSEPSRGEGEKLHEASILSSLRFFGRYFRRHGFLWVVLLAGSTIYTAAISGASVWAPTFGMRRYGATGVGAIALLGTFSVAGSLVGSILGGVLSQRAINSGNPRALTRLYVILPAIGWIFAASFPFMPSWTLAVVGIGVAGALGTATGLLLSIGVQETAPNEARGQLIGLFGLVTFIPPIVGGTLVAFLATHVFAHTGGLAPALALVGGSTGVLAVLLFAFSGTPFERAQRELRALDLPSPTTVT